MKKFILISIILLTPTSFANFIQCETEKSIFSDGFTTKCFQPEDYGPKRISPLKLKTPKIPPTEDPYERMLKNSRKDPFAFDIEDIESFYFNN